MAERPKLSFVNFKAGHYIFVEGNAAPCFYIIREGQVKITRDTVALAHENGTLGPGDFFGIVSALSSRNHIETAKALTDVTLLAVDKNQFAGLIQFNAPIAIKIIKQYSNTIRSQNAALTRLTFETDQDSDGSENLYATGEYYLKRREVEKAAYIFRRYIRYYPRDRHSANVAQYLAALEPKVEKEAEPQKGFVRRVEAGHFVFAEGEPGAELFIIQSGSVNITKIVDDKEIILAILQTGDMFGEMALLEAKPRSANAIVYQNAQLMVLAITNFESVANSQPDIIARLTQILSERIWFSYKKLLNTEITEPLGRMYDAMGMYLERNKVDLSSSVSYSFDFGPAELAKMVGIQDAEVSACVRELMADGVVSLINDKLYVTEVKGVGTKSSYYRKMSKQRQNNHTAGHTEK
jgi:CRP-like cAMP-binding protein